jgi:hypothetical protein
MEVLFNRRCPPFLLVRTEGECGALVELCRQRNGDVLGGKPV